MKKYNPKRDDMIMQASLISLMVFMLILGVWVGADAENTCQKQVNCFHFRLALK